MFSGGKVICKISNVRLKLSKGDASFYLAGVHFIINFLSKFAFVYK